MVCDFILLAVFAICVVHYEAYFVLCISLFLLLIRFKNLKKYVKLLFCSCVESYLQSTYWPEPCESSGELEEPVKKKPRRTQVCFDHFVDL